MYFKQHAVITRKLAKEEYETFPCRQYTFLVRKNKATHLTRTSSQLMHAKSFALVLLHSEK